MKHLKEKSRKSDRDLLQVLQVTGKKEGTKCYKIKVLLAKQQLSDELNLVENLSSMLMVAHMKEEQQQEMNSTRTTTSEEVNLVFNVESAPGVGASAKILPLLCDKCVRANL